MRPKTMQCVITFHTTNDAMAFEKKSKEEGLMGRLIPLPRSIGAGCGLAWREDHTNKTKLEVMIATNQLTFDTMYEIEL